MSYLPKLILLFAFIAHTNLFAQADKNTSDADIGPIFAKPLSTVESKRILTKHTDLFFKTVASYGGDYDKVLNSGAEVLVFGKDPTTEHGIINGVLPIIPLHVVTHEKIKSFHYVFAYFVLTGGKEISNRGSFDLLGFYESGDVAAIRQTLPKNIWTKMKKSHSYSRRVFGIALSKQSDGTYIVVPNLKAIFR